MSTHRHLKAALDRAVDAHRKAHRGHLAEAGLEDQGDATVSPLGPAGDMGGDAAVSDA